MSENIDVNAILSKPIFTIPVELVDRDEEGAEVSRNILVRYTFDDEIEEEIDKGLPDDKATEEAKENAKALAGEGNPVPEIKPITRSLTIAEQLAIIVKGIKGISVPLNTQYWRGVPMKHKRAIITAINADINPPKTPSVV